MYGDYLGRSHGSAPQRLLAVWTKTVLIDQECFGENMFYLSMIWVFLSLATKRPGVTEAPSAAPLGPVEIKAWRQALQDLEWVSELYRPCSYLLVAFVLPTGLGKVVAGVDSQRADERNDPQNIRVADALQCCTSVAGGAADLAPGLKQDMEHTFPF